ncbi:MAG TPA: glutaminyl-peptide cyclotransferase [Candidatus Hydrogenedentes bacterium]|nr:glutaminyl-peptide cyclotransferase [Candidatus Hydrogenedentota bacterium]
MKVRLVDAIRWLRMGAILPLALWCPCCYAGKPAPDSTARRYTFEVIREYPHDPRAFTQGLLWENGRLYESTGAVGGPSTLREVDLESGGVTRITEVPGVFAEGLASLRDGRLIQLTWKDGQAFVRDRDTFRITRTFRYDGEGWGLTWNGEHLVMSDGSACLRFRDPETFDVRREITVHDGSRTVRNLNELEWVRGRVWANIWQSDWVVIVNPDDGQVEGWLCLQGLLPQSLRAGRDVDVLNGIAWDPEKDRMFFTGKRWPRLYEVRVKEIENAPGP